MQADLEFEYPQKLEKIVVKNEILSWLENEEEKLKNIALEYAMNKQASDKSKGKLIPGDEFLLTYDEYFNNTEDVGMGAMGFGFRTSKNKISYEAFLNQHASKNMFDNDMIDMQYKFWETPEDREERLKKTWIEL